MKHFAVYIAACLASLLSVADGDAYQVRFRGNGSLTLTDGKESLSFCIGFPMGGPNRSGVQNHVSKLGARLPRAAGDLAEASSSGAR